MSRTSSMTRVLAICLVSAPAFFAACSDELGNQSLSAPGYTHPDSGFNNTVPSGDDDDNTNVYEAGPDPEFDSTVPMPEGGPIDSGLKDAGTVVDSGVKDSGVVDSGVKDSGVADSGVADSGVTDSGIADAAAGQ